MKKKFSRITSLLLSLALMFGLFSDIGGLLKAEAYSKELTATEHHIDGYGYDFSNSGLRLAYNPYTQKLDDTAYQNKYCKGYWYYFTNEDGKICYCMQLGVKHYDSVDQMQMTLDEFAGNKNFEKHFNSTQLDWLRYATIYGYKDKTHYGYSWQEELIATQSLVWSITAKYYDVSQTELGVSETKMLNCLTNVNKSHIKDIWQKMKSNIRNHTTIPNKTSPKPTPMPSNAKYLIPYNPATNKWEKTIKLDNYLQMFSIPSVSGVSITKKNTDDNYRADSLVISAAKSSSLNSSAIKMTKQTSMQDFELDGCSPLIMMAKSQNANQNKLTYYNKADPVEAYFALAPDLGDAELQKKFVDSQGKAVTANATMYNAVAFNLVYTYGGKDYYVKATGNSGNYTFSATGNRSVATTFRTDSTGKITVKGLPAGNYNWKEIGTYPGYALVDDTHYVLKTGATAKVTVDNQEETPDQINFTKDILDVDGAAADLTDSKIATALANVFRNCTFSASVKLDNGKTVYLTADKNPAGEGIYLCTGYTADKNSATVFKLNGKGKMYIVFSAHPETKVLLDQAEPIKITEMTAPQNLGYYKQNYTTVNKDNTNCKITNKERQFVVNLVKTDAETGARVDGAEYTLYAAEDIYNIFGQLVYSKDQAVESITTPTASFSPVNFGRYYVKETAAPDGYFIDENVYTVSPELDGTSVVVNADEAVTATVESEERQSTGKITVYKYDSNNTAYPLSGAEFGVFATDDVTVAGNIYKNGDIIENIITGDDGTAVTVKDYPVKHNFEIREISAPANYKIADPSQLVKLKFDDVLEYVTGSAEFFNEYKQGKIVIYKTDKKDNKKYLSGAEFKVTAAEDVIVAGKKIYSAGDVIEENLVTDQTGRTETTAPLYAGYSYTVTETKAPIGYSLNSEPQTVNLADDGTNEVVFNVTFGNDEWFVEFDINKTDVSNGELIPNCTFEILDENMNRIVTGVTDANGIATFTLKYGNYYYREISAPEQYVIDSTPYAFSILEEGVIVKADMTNRKKQGDIEITKLDMSSKAPVPNCGIRILNSDQEEIMRGYTDENGKIVFKGLTYGEYFFQEFDAPAGYILNEDLHKFSIIDDGVTVKDNLEDIRQTGKIKVATFTNIPIGTYTIYEDEKTVPFGYMVADEKQVTVAYAETIDETVLNLEKTGAVKIHKTTEGNFNIEGITLILSGTSDTGREINEKAITDKDGIAIFSNVPIGTYTVTEDESTVPYGYLVADEKQVTVAYAETIDETILNKEKTGSVKVQKKTNGMTNIEGIKFILRGTSDTGREIYLEAESDKNGVAKFENVPVGTYTIYEDGSSVPYGYLVAEPQSVTVNYAETVDAEFYNNKIPNTPSTGMTAKDGRAILLTIIFAGAILTVSCKRRKKED